MKEQFKINAQVTVISTDVYVVVYVPLGFQTCYMYSTTNNDETPAKICCSSQRQVYLHWADSVFDLSASPVANPRSF